MSSRKNRTRSAETTEIAHHDSADTADQTTEVTVHDVISMSREDILMLLAEHTPNTPEDDYIGLDDDGLRLYADNELNNATVREVENIEPFVSEDQPEPSEEEEVKQKEVEEKPKEEQEVVSAVAASNVAEVVGSPTTADLMREVANLRQLLIDAGAGKGKRRVASGSKARPNVKYTLLKRPPKWSATPQVAQLEQILFSQDKMELTEPELFALVTEGKAAGKLKTNQDPVRIFQYYRGQLLQNDVLRWA